MQPGRRACLGPILLTAFVLCGCAGPEVVRGRMHYDLRADGQRTSVVLPAAPEVPRYRYLGELVGEANFARSDSTKTKAVDLFKWLVGLFENNQPLTLVRPQHGVASDTGRVYVVDAGRGAILVFDPNPPKDDKSDDGEGQLLLWQSVGAGIRLTSPVALALAWDGDVVVSDVALGAVLRINPAGELVAVLGAEEIKRPTGLAFDRERALLYVADTLANEIKVYDATGRMVKAIGTAGEDAGQFNAPTHLAFANDHLYVSDTLNNRVQIFDTQGKRVDGFGERGLYVGNFTRPKGVAVDAGIVYVVESYFGYLLAYNDQHELLIGINGNGLKGDKFILPSGVWTDNSGRIYVADTLNGRVVVFQLLEKENS